MTDRPDSHTVAPVPALDALQRLTQFAKDLGLLTDLPAAAARVLSELSACTRHDQGALYVIDRERDCYRRQATIGAYYSGREHATIPVGHSLVHQLVGMEQRIRPPERHDAAPGAITGAPFTDPEGWSADLTLPLMNRNRLVAFLLLGPAPASDLTDADPHEWLSVQTQTAANALDAILIRDDLARSQALMRRTDRLRSLEIIAGGFAHEIRNPLTSIKTFIQLAPTRKDDTEFISDFSRIVLDDVYRIERLVEEILDYARYMEPKLTEEDFNEIVTSCLYFVGVKAESRGIKIEKELAPGLPRVMLDRQQIKQVLLNLLLNAMDAMEQGGGTLRVRTGRVSGPDGVPGVRVEIEDTGPGISPANLEHIFDPFFTTKHASEEREGTGLGLTIAHQIIQEHQGTLLVTSTEGVGTTFFVTLPAAT